LILLLLALLHFVHLVYFAYFAITQIVYITGRMNGRTQWLTGRVSGSRLRGPRFTLIVDLLKLVWKCWPMWLNVTIELLSLAIASIDVASW